MVTPDLSQLFGISEEDSFVPEVDDIMRVTSISKIDHLQISISMKFTARNILPIPPFMVNRLSMTIQETLRDNKAVLLEAINLIREFNKEMHKIGETVEDAKNSCKDLLFCLFLINRNKVYSVPMIACCNIRMQSHFKGLEKQYLANEHSVI